MKAVLFDLDETLLDRSESLHDFVRWQAEGMLRFELKNKELYISRFIELDVKGSVWKDIVYKTLIDEFSIQNFTVTELPSTYELCFWAFSKPKPGAIKAVKILHSLGVKLALVSNGKSPFQERNFRSLGISNIFDAVIISEAAGMRKPQKEIFKLACDTLKVLTSNTVFVGDSIENDIIGANDAGIYSIYMPSDSSQECKYANIVCTSFDELPEIIMNSHSL